ncbi:MAG: hypothetical protein K0R92_1015 [Lachnospiraceae bacterium]|jgi:hypothetical protein|nr:hypothetical protein [Lachnospiraceae bacterium]
MAKTQAKRLLAGFHKKTGLEHGFGVENDKGN